MGGSPSSTLARYGIAIAALAAAIAVRIALNPWLGGTFPLVTMSTAVAFVVWRVGAGPALFTGVAGWAVANVIFRGGLGFFGGITINESVGFLLYMMAILPIIAIGVRMRAANPSIAEQREALSSSNQQLESKVEAQALLAAIVASSSDAIISKTLDGIITSWNKGAERVFGWTAQEAIGQSIHLIIPPEWRDQERDILERLRRGERIEHIDVERVRKNGSRLHLSVTISPVVDRHGHIIGASKTARDITDRKAWEEGLVRSTAAQRLLIGIHDATRGLEDPSIVMREIVTRVGLHFDVTRCAYGEVDAEHDQITITKGYTRNFPTVAGRYPLDAFGPLMVGELKNGRTAIIDDVSTDPLTDHTVARETYARMSIASLVCVPSIRGGTLIGVLVMCDTKPRKWDPEEARLLEQVAERTRFAVESARATLALREHRDVMKLAMSTGKMGAWTRDLLLDTVWWSPEFAQIVGISDRGARTLPLENGPELITWRARR